jgi:hypothetical protein
MRVNNVVAALAQEASQAQDAEWRTPPILWNDMDRNVNS